MLFSPSRHDSGFGHRRAKGRPDSIAAGNAKAAAWLGRYVEPDIDPALDADLLDHIARRSSELAPRRSRDAQG